MAVGGTSVMGFVDACCCGCGFVGGATIVGGCDDGTTGDGGAALGGFTVGGFSVDGADSGAIDGCVVGDGIDVRGATSIFGTGGGIRPGKTVGGWTSMPVSMTIGATGRFTDATTDGDSGRRVGS